MNSDYFDLKKLENHPGYQKLQGLWAHEGSKIMESAFKAGAKGQESAWRYYAGQMKGFDLAITHLSRALMDMEKQGAIDASEEGQMSSEDILKELRGEFKQ